MDLDDSFTEKLLNRAKARKEYLTSKKTESPMIISKKRPVLTEESQRINEAAEDVLQDDSPKRQRLSLPSEEYEKENVQMEDIEEEEPFVSFKASSNRGLAALRNKHSADSTDDDEKASNGSTSSTEANTYLFATNGSDLCSTRKGRLANLAANINQWEDDTQALSNVATSRKPNSAGNFSSSSSSSGSKSSVSSDSRYSKPSSVEKSSDLRYSKPISSEKSTNGIKSTYVFGGFGRSAVASDSDASKTPPVFEKADANSGFEKNKISKRINVWEQAVQAALETETNVKPPINAQTNVNMERESSAEESEEEVEELIDEQPITRDEKPNNKHVFGKISQNDNLNKSFEPSDLPLSARKALFEKALLGYNTGPALPPEKLSVAQRAAMFETANKTNSRPKPPSNFVEPKVTIMQKSSPKAAPFHQSPSKNVGCVVSKNSPVKNTANPSPLSPAKNVGAHTRQVHQQLVKNAANNWQQKEIVANAVVERKAEISNLVSHWEKLSSTSSVGNANCEEGNNQEPQIPEEEYESEEEEEIEEDTFYGSEMESERYEKESEANWTEQDETTYPNDISQSEPDVSDSEQEVFNPKRFSDQAGLTNFDVDTDYTTDNDAGSYYDRPNSNYTTMSSESISIKSSTSDANSHSLTKSQHSSSGGSTSSHRETDLAEDVFVKPTAVSSGSPLCHTVSFYRRQKQVTRTPPMQTIVRREPVVEEEAEEDDQSEMIQERIKLLQDEIIRQQTVISQTSQALNLCHATAEFSGSTEQVEGERLLLIATQKRQACLNEIQRLKSHGAQGLNIPDGSGTLTISDIQLPLKRDFIAAQLEGKISDTVHCFLCLIRHGPQVIVTQMVSTIDNISDGALCFTNHIKLQNLPSDFSVVFEVYALQTKKEVLPHDKKYHIKKEKARLTPKGKKGDTKLLFPGISSPGGPNAVRSPSFAVVGFTRFTIQNNNKKCFSLDKVPFSSPLEGVLKVRLHLHAEHKVVEKGFLTMFEDVSGFGAWHRRWCSLDSRHLSFWKYPDDETKKEPIGRIDLRQCVTAQVKLVSRDICARPHTFQLLTLRPLEKGDKNTLVSRSVDTLTSTKHLISADTKEERIAWCSKLNEALMNLRKWDPKALKPIEEKQE